MGGKGDYTESIRILNPVLPLRCITRCGITIYILSVDIRSIHDIETPKRGLDDVKVADCYV